MTRKPKAATPEPEEQAAEPEVQVEPAEQAEPEVPPEPEEQAEPDAQAQVGSQPRSIADTLAQADQSWARFHALASRFPPERMDERIGDGWTRKQMLAHVAGWHDLATDRLLAFVKTGARQRLEHDVDVINGRLARAATGRTVGEVLHSLESSFRRLRRQVEAMTDDQLAMHDGWPAALISGDTYEHYAEHGRDLELPPEPVGTRR